MKISIFNEFSSFLTRKIYTKSMTILCIGQSVYDIYYVFDTPLLENQKRRADHWLQCMGGPVANASYLCALWGADTYTMARVGNDAFGNNIVETLQSIGVHTTSMLVDANTNTSISSILVNSQNGTRTIMNIPLSEEANLDVQWPEDVDVILMDGHELPLCKKALEKYPNAVTIFDGDKLKPASIDIIKKVDYLICSEEFASEYTKHVYNSDTYSEVCALNGNTILTIGEKGCIYKEKNYPAYPVKVVDSTGAGDVFHGAFAYGMDQGWEIETCIDVASKAASLACTKIGGMTSIPPLSSVL